jgi:hypothetical protein
MNLSNVAKACDKQHHMQIDAPANGPFHSHLLSAYSHLLSASQARVAYNPRIAPV